MMLQGEGEGGGGRGEGFCTGGNQGCILKLAPAVN